MLQSIFFKHKLDMFYYYRRNLLKYKNYLSMKTFEKQTELNINKILLSRNHAPHSPTSKNTLKRK